MDGSWGTIATAMQHQSGRPPDARSVRKGPKFPLTTGEKLSSEDAVGDARNVHRLTRKQLYRRLRANERHRQKNADHPPLSPEELYGEVKT